MKTCQDRPPRRRKRDPKRAINEGEELNKQVSAAFELQTDRVWLEEFAFKKVCDALVRPDRLTYELAVLIDRKGEEAHRRTNDLFGDVSDIIIEEAAERLLAEPEEVLDELMEEKKD